MMNQMVRNRGFALVFAIFLAVGLETVLAGNIFNALRWQRDAAEQTARITMGSVADGVINRAIELIQSYVVTYGNFPPTVTVAGREEADSDHIEFAAGGQFSQFLYEWYAASGGFQDQFPGVLDNITIPSAADVLFEEMQGTGLPAARRRYQVSVLLHDAGTDVRISFAQVFEVDRGTNLFDFATFFENDLEIAPGPTSAFEGPTHTNGDLDLVTDQTSTLTLRRAQDFATSPYRFVANAAGHTYYFHKRAVARNYLLDIANYRDNVSAAYRDAPGGIEVLPYFGEGSIPAPMFYYYVNGLEAADSYSGAALKIEDINGALVSMTHPGEYDPGGCSQVAPMTCHMVKMRATGLYADNAYYTTLTDYANMSAAGRKMNVSSAIDFNNYPALLAPEGQASWTEADPLSQPPPLNPSWNNGRGIFSSSVNATIEDAVPKRTIPIGGNLDPHTVIEPLMSRVFPSQTPDAQAVADQKLQSQATIDLYCREPCQSVTDLSPHLADLVTKGIAGYLNMADVRVSNFFNPARVLQIDIGALLQDPVYNLIDPDPNVKPKALIYVHAWPLQNSLNDLMAGLAYRNHEVRLVNAEKLPKGGLTMVTNGRLWVKGDYDIFDYAKDAGAGRNCTAEEWDARDCLPPPAALMSDSFGILSKQWNDTYLASSSLSARDVTQDVTVNAAIAAGALKSQLERRIPVTATDLTSCSSTSGLDHIKVGSGCEIVPTPSSAGDRYLFTGYDSFRCPDGSYVNGRYNPATTTGAAASCEYYKDLTTGVYYVNRYSTLYQTAMANNIAGGYTTTPLPLPDPVTEPLTEIPLYLEGTPANAALMYANLTYSERASQVTPLTKPFLYGVAYYGLTRGSLTGGCPGTYVCPGPDSTCNGNTCAGNQTCYNPPAESGLPPYCYGCNVDLTCPFPLKSTLYWRSMYLPLYRTRYSGGLESLVNHEEDWNGIKLRMLGTLSSPWSAKELKYGTSTLYWAQGNDIVAPYYKAPIRDFHYNSTFALADPSMRPPGTPRLFSVTRTQRSVKR